MPQNLNKINEILVAIDFSDCSVAAFKHACLFAKDFSANVTLFHGCGTYGQEISDYAIDYLGSLENTSLPSLREIAEKEMERFVDQNPAPGINIKTEIKDIGPINKAVLEYQEENGAELLVIGTHGKKGLSRWILGSTAEKIIKKSACPTLIVHEEPRDDNTKESYSKILLATDFSDHSEFAFSQSLVLAKKFNANLDLVHIVDERTFLPLRAIATQAVLDDYRKELRDEAKEKMEQYISSHSDSKAFFKSHVLTGIPFKEITELSKKLKSDLMVLGSHGHVHLSDILMGSTAQRIIQESHCPLLLVK